MEVQTSYYGALSLISSPGRLQTVPLLCCELSTDNRRLMAPSSRLNLTNYIHLILVMVVRMDDRGAGRSGLHIRPIVHTILALELF